jgi:hypothetical protein
MSATTIARVMKFVMSFFLVMSILGMIFADSAGLMVWNGFNTIFISRTFLIDYYTDKFLGDLKNVSFALVNAGKPWEHVFKEATFEASDHFKRLLDLTKWRYHDFYPDLKRHLNTIVDDCSTT